MSEFLNWYTFLAFIAGVLLSSMVKALVSKVRGSA